ncbi:MAG: hypothetical protein JSU86_04945 [Phycisphaerales bacterium]|nr:MAG: hypothetical protein JSU86_04945 [Phycisphaerales bacterium]
MTPKRTLVFVLKIIALTFALFFGFILASIVAGVAEVDVPSAPPDVSASAPDTQGTEPVGQQLEQMKAALNLLIVCFLQTLVLTYVIVRSRWHGWRLAATIFVIFFGVTAIMTQIEMLVFRPQDLTGGVLPRLLAMSLLTTGVFSPLAVLVLGKRKSREDNHLPNTRLIIGGTRWAWVLATAVVAYVTLYVAFGYFIVWQHPVAREFYGGGGSRSGSFPAHILYLVQHHPRLLALQALRALMWVALALPVIRMMKGHWVETALAVAMLFGVVFSIQLLVPNPWMPQTLRMLHLLETSTSNFMFGFLLGWLFSCPDRRPYAAPTEPEL